MLAKKTYRLITENGEIEIAASSFDLAVQEARKHVKVGELCAIQMKGAKSVHFYKKGETSMWPISPKAAALEYAMILAGSKADA